MSHLIKFRFTILSIFLLLPVTASSIEIVRFNIESGGLSHTVDIELFDVETPLTVANFLGYVDTTRYDGSFIHRSVSDFVLQGGGFTFYDTSGDFIYEWPTQAYAGGLQPVATASDLTVDNEFQGSGKSNTRGTIAMAKLADLPDSATSQWFVNMVDNASLLDNTNEGYTVFGEVLDRGMEIFDQLALLPIYNKSFIHPSMGELVLNNYIDNDPVTESNLVRLSSVARIARPIIQADVTKIDFGLVVLGNSSQVTVTLTNRGTADLVMEAASLSALAAPYSLNDISCVGSTLAPNSIDSCSFIIQYSPVALGGHNTSVTITPSVNPHNINLTLDITGEGASVMPSLFIVEQPLILDFADVAFDAPASLSVTVQNKGGGTLNITSIAVSGSDASMFAPDAGCNGAALVLAQTCTVAVTFTPTVDGLRVAELEINSDMGSAQVALTGIGVGPEIVVPLTHDAGYTPIGVTNKTVFEIKNIGPISLEITDISISGPNAAEFSQDNTCPNVATINTTPLSPTYGTCFVVVIFTPVSEGIKTATFTITSTDGDEGVVNVTVTGGVGLDSDGIAIIVEDAAPNAGDGNNDTVQDSAQDNVASFVTEKGSYATIASPEGTSLLNVTLEAVPDVANAPQGVVFPHGVFKYEISVASLSPDAVVKVGLFLPSGDNAGKYYKYGPTHENTTSHWYDFTYDGVTGVQYVGDVNVTEPGGGGVSINRSMFLIYYIDGERGDDDLTVDGVISSTGAVGVVKETTTGSGSVSLLWLVFALLCRLTRGLSRQWLFLNRLLVR